MPEPTKCIGCGAVIHDDEEYSFVEGTINPNALVCHHCKKAVNDGFRLSKELCDAVNVGDECSFGRALAIGFANQHRTLQQSFFRAFCAFLHYYKDTRTDARNEAAVEMAKKWFAVSQDQTLPFI